MCGKNANYEEWKEEWDDAVVMWGSYAPMVPLFCLSIARYDSFCIANCKYTMKNMSTKASIESLWLFIHGWLQHGIYA